MEPEIEFWAKAGVWIDTRSKQCGLKRSQLAASVGVHRNTITKWITGEQSFTAWHFERMKQVFRESGK